MSQDKVEAVKEILHPECYGKGHHGYPCPVPDWGACSQCKEEATQICQLFKVKLPENPYPEHIFPRNVEETAKLLRARGVTDEEMTAHSGAWGRHVYLFLMKEIKEFYPWMEVE